MPAPQPKHHRKGSFTATPRPGFITRAETSTILNIGPISALRNSGSARKNAAALCRRNVLRPRGRKQNIQGQGLYRRLSLKYYMSGRDAKTMHPETAAFLESAADRACKKGRRRLCSFKKHCEGEKGILKPKTERYQTTAPVFSVCSLFFRKNRRFPMNTRALCITPSKVDFINDFILGFVFSKAADMPAFLCFPPPEAGYCYYSPSIARFFTAGKSRRPLGNFRHKLPFRVFFVGNSPKNLCLSLRKPPAPVFFPLKSVEIQQPQF